MNPTLFLIPSSWFEGPLLYGWLVIGLIIMAVMYVRQGSTKDVIGFLPMYLIIAAVIYYLLPRIQVPGINPEDPSGALINVGLAIRGWGFCLLLAMSCAVGLIYLRCRQTGFDFDKILSLTFWMIVVGIVGARLFYIIQKWDQFAADSAGDLLAKLVDATKGGMVVYGSLIGGLVAAGIYFWMTKLDWRKSMDIVAPAMVLGLAIGRVGCLMNGCCFGGVCDNQLGLEFPAGSPPYLHQLYNGQLIGLETGPNPDSSFYPLKVESVGEESIAAQKGIQVGDRVAFAAPDSEYFRAVHGKQLEFPEWAHAVQVGVQRDLKEIDQVDLEKTTTFEIGIPLEQLPSGSLKIHPTQIYSAIAAALLTAFLWFYFPYRKFDGEVFALLIIIYPIARFLLEAIRSDEAGQLNTDFTISQIVSMIAIVGGFAVWAWCRMNSKPSPTA